MNLCTSRRSKYIGLLTDHCCTSRSLGCHSVIHTPITLIQRRVQTIQQTPSAVPQKIHNTIYQSAIHIHRTTLQHIHQQLHSTSYLKQDTFLFVLPQLAAHLSGERLDPAQPTRAAHTFIRIFSKESAKREMRPFYSDVVRSVLREEQERYRTKPTKAISLIWNLFGQHNAFRTLTRFYLGTVEKMGSHYFPALTSQNALYLAAGVLIHSRVYQRYIHQIWNQENRGVPLRYSSKEAPLTEELMRLPIVRRTFFPSREELERMVRSSDQEHTPASTPPQTTPEVRLSESDFRALVRGVTSSIGRQTRLESLRKGGM